MERERDAIQGKFDILKLENESYTAWVGDEMSRIKQECDKENKKLNRDKKLWEKQKKAADILPTKRSDLY